MAEIKEITNMNTTFHMDEQSTLVHVPHMGEMTIGRSPRADYRIEGMGVSNFHVNLKRGKVHRAQPSSWPPMSPRTGRA
jgi:hypothetical protein